MNWHASRRFAWRTDRSVAANIVEGSARNSERDYLHFLNIAEASLRETEYFLLLARDLGSISLPGFGRRVARTLRLSLARAERPTIV
ncbi:MAG: four helix bundle protein [Lentisphaeria bacterium]|nr:four helix bundle protein [Lentisphaeria bacterium]